MKIYTSRYSNKDLATADAHIVGITLYPPRFPVKFKLEGNIGQLAPQKSYFKTADKALFRRRYLEQIEKNRCWKSMTAIKCIYNMTL